MRTSKTFGYMVTTRTYLANTADLVGVTTLRNGNYTAKLVTSDATLDLTNKSIETFNTWIQSSNPTGTNFLINNTTDAFAVYGGAGQDTITLAAGSFSAGQRDAVLPECYGNAPRNGHKWQRIVSRPR
jgi:hypothetical protein